MELDDLKGVWGEFSSRSEKANTLTENRIETMIGKQTTDISQKIGRNFRIGLGIALAWACFNLSADFFFSPFIEKYMDQPNDHDPILLSIFIVEIFSYVLIFGSLFLFWFRFSKIDNRQIDRSDLRQTLTAYIKIIDAYRKMFYLILILVLIYVIISFGTGFVIGFTQEMDNLGTQLSDLSVSRWTIVVISFLLTAGLIIGIYILLFNLFYKKLYGRYLAQLKSSLNELNEKNFIGELEHDQQ